MKPFLFLLFCLSRQFVAAAYDSTYYQLCYAFIAYKMDHLAQRNEFAPGCMASGTSVVGTSPCNFNKFLDYVRHDKVTGWPSGGIQVSDFTSTKDIDSAVEELDALEYPKKQFIDMLKIDPSFQVPQDREYFGPTFKQVYSFVTETIVKALAENRRRKATGTLKKWLQVAIYCLEKIREVRQAEFDKRLPNLMEQYIQWKGWGFKVAKLDTGLIDWEGTIASNPSASDQIKREVKLDNMSAWAAINIPNVQKQSPLFQVNFAKTHASVIQNCEIWIEQLKGLSKK